MLSERRDLSGLSCVHVTASTPVGLVLFVLADVVAKDFDVLEANWPRNMASVQGADMSAGVCKALETMSC